MSPFVRWCAFLHGLPRRFHSVSSVGTCLQRAILPARIQERKTFVRNNFRPVLLGPWKRGPSIRWHVTGAHLDDLHLPNGARFASYVGLVMEVQSVPSVSRGWS
jgi:hypothetical protein